jgi:rRNA-processing protein FCF1
MTTNQEKKLRDLLDKYNDVLLHSMRIAIAEDFINLMIQNRDDIEFELKDLLKNKDILYNVIMKEFLKRNSSSVVTQLRSMDEPFKIKKKAKTKTSSKKKSKE